jgi:RNA polymerase sigma factor (sigma-70 family)
MLPLMELDSLISGAYLEGQTHFGELGLDLPTYSARINSILAKHLGLSSNPKESASFVKALHGRDLYLTTACAKHSPGKSVNGSTNGSTEHADAAWKALELNYKTFVYDLVRFFYRPGFVSQDLADNIIADLFLPDRSGVSRIASYDGRSSLSTWLRVIVCNRSINAQRCSANSKCTDIQPEMPDKPALLNIEMTLRARRYRACLKDALARACNALTPRERLVLLWRYEDGLQLGQIAKLLGIHQSNVTRQLERMQNRLRDNVIAVLSTKHGLSGLAINECLEDVVCNPRHEISILDFIKQQQRSARDKHISMTATANSALSRRDPAKAPKASAIDSEVSNGA